MDELLLTVNWTAVVLGAGVAFVMGWVWYSDYVFGKPWRVGSGQTNPDLRRTRYALLTHAFATFLIAWVVAVAESFQSLQFVVLLTLAIGTVVKTHGLYSQKSLYAIGVEVGYVWIMVCIMVIAHGVLQ